MNKLISLKIRKIIDKILFTERKKYFHFEDVRLFPSEIHLILYIYEHEGKAKNATKIARYVGVTKGAISQNLSRLEKKGILVKEKDHMNKNELNLCFTNKGEKLLKHFLLFQDKFLRIHNKTLKKFTEDQKSTILEFLSSLDEIIEHNKNNII